MKNSFNLIKWMAIPFVLMIVILIGMAVMRGFDGFMKENDEELEIVDNDPLNNALAPFKGYSTGSKVRQLINFLVKNAKENEKNKNYLPDIAYQLTGGEDFKIIESTVKEPNEKEINNIAMKFDSRHGYTVEYKYSKRGIVNAIIIKYNENTKFEFEPNDN